MSATLSETDVALSQKVLGDITRRIETMLDLAAEIGLTEFTIMVDTETIDDMTLLTKSVASYKKRSTVMEAFCYQTARGIVTKLFLTRHP